jgi:nucleotide-binding universal stress UspA family protein
MNFSAELRLRAVSFGNILFAMDFSPTSLLAFPFAAQIALHYGGKVFVVHVAPEKDQDTVSKQKSLVHKLQSALEESLNGSSRSLTQIPHEFLFDHGSICSRLLAAAENHEIDLIVIGTHGWHGVTKLLRGSTAEEIAHVATKPVFTVGPKISRGPDFKHILYATDFLPAATHALPYAISFAQNYRADLLLLHVNDWNSRETPMEARPKTSAYFHQYLGKYGKEWLHPDVIVDFGPTVDRIVEHAVVRNVDLIVMGLHHQDKIKAGIAAHLPGSTAYDVVSQAYCPVMTVPLPKETQTQS